MHYVDLFREKAHFPFLKLPAEIRVMIYKLAFVSDRWIMVIDMDFLEFEDLEESGPPLRRNTYRMDASIAGYISETSRQEYRRTTYECRWSSCACRTCSNKIESTPLLSVCRQINTEAVPIFYGMNKFKLCSMLAITPFLQDRSPKSLAQIKHVRMSFGLDKDGAKRRQVTEIYPRLHAPKFTAQDTRHQCLFLHSMQHGGDRGPGPHNAMGGVSYLYQQARGLERRCILP